MSNSIFKSTIYVTAVTFFIKFLGLIKQTVLAASCGANDETDAFFIASGVLLSLCLMIFSAISISLLSIHTDTLIHKGRGASNDLINASLRVFLPVSLLLTIFFIAFSPYVAKFLAPTYRAEQLATLAKYIRLMSCVFILWCYYLTVNVILETDKEFIPGRCQGLFQNVFLIIAALFFYKSHGMFSLVLAFIASGVAECILVTWFARRRLKFIFHKLATPKKEVLNLLTISAPLIIGNALYEINDIVDKQISSGLGSGNVSYLTYGATINEIVSGVVVGSISIILFANFATWVSEGNITKLQNSLEQSNEIIFTLVMPIIAVCLFAGDDLLWVLYGRGSFGERDVLCTYYVVIGYSVGFIFSATRANIVKVFYAFQDTKKPLINGVISISINICLSIVLSRFLGVGGVALATSMAMFVSLFLLSKQLKVYLPSFSFRSSAKEYWKGMVAFVCCCFPLFILKANDSMNVSLKLIIEVVLCVIIYFGVLLIEKSEVCQMLIRKISK